MMHRFFLLFGNTRIAILCMVFWALAGCSSSPEQSVTSYGLKFERKAQVNDSAPLKIRVLMLKSAAGFESADFYSLQNDAQNILGDHLVGSEAFFLTAQQPGKKISGQSKGEARYIGIIAEYQQLDGKKWRLSLPLTGQEKSSFFSFWRWSSDESETVIVADADGLRVVNQDK